MFFSTLFLISLPLLAQVEHCPERFRLEAFNGAEVITLYDGDEIFELRPKPSLRYLEKGKTPMVFSNYPTPGELMLLPRYQAISHPASTVFTLNYVTAEDDGVCDLGAVTEEEF